MSESKHLQQRDSRDRVIDILGIGETSPLRDVLVSDELKVRFQRSAKITITPGQLGVHYELRDHNGDGPQDRRDSPLERDEDGKLVPVAGVGDGTMLELVTPAILEDRTFTIHAAKLHPQDDGTVSVREVFLRQSVHIKVGLDVDLVSRLRIAGDVLPLFANQVGDADPRITMYGSTATVEVVGAQDGVDYDLISIDANDKWISRSGPAVRGMGDGVTISIVSTAMTEDIELRVRATKKYTVAENREVEVDLLTARLNLKVRANPDVVVSSPDGAVFDHASAPVLRIDGTQASASYQLYARPIHDREFTAAMVVTRPPWTSVWTEQDGFVPVGPTVAGNGASIDIKLDTRLADTVVLVRASKLHLAASPATSAVQLKNAVNIFLRPDPAPALELRVNLSGTNTTGIIELIGGQRGVLYFLRAAQDGPDLGLPAYVHQRDEDTPGKWKGVGQMRVEADLVVSDERGGEAPPFTYTQPLPVGTTIFIRAVKAQSQLATPLLHTATIQPVPEITYVQAGVDAGASAKIRVQPSDSKDRYQLTLAGTPVRAAQGGNGGELILTSDPVAQDVVFTVEAIPLHDPDIGVRRVVPVSVPLRPRADLTTKLLAGDPLGPDPSTRIYDHAVDVQVAVEATEPGMIYRLVEADKDSERTLSTADVVGTGTTIALQIDHVTEDVVARVRVIRTFFADVAEAGQPQLLLDTVLSLKVRADPTLSVTVDPSQILEPGAATTLVIADSQKSAQYEVYVRPVQDADRRFGGEPEAPMFTLAVDEDPPVGALRPLPPGLWDPAAGFVQVGATVAGTGGALPLAIPDVREDLVAVIKARKLHVAEPVVESAIQLLGGALLLVTPDLDPPLTVRAEITPAQKFEAVEFLGGQPGVFYVLLDSEGKPLGESGYVHGKDLADPANNRGVGQLRVGTDFVVPRDPIDMDHPGDPATVDPQPALVATGARQLGEVWAVRATWALTRVSRRLTSPAAIDPPPQIAAKQAVVSTGATAEIVVSASRVGDRYWLTLNDVAIGDVQVGDGNDRLFVSEPLTQTSRFLIHCATGEAPALVVERVVAIEVVVGG